MDSSMNTESVKSAIRKAVDEWKEKTWYDFHGVAYEEMYEFLGDKYVTIPKDEYNHLIHCKEELIQLHEAYLQSMRTDMATSQMANIVSQQVTPSTTRTRTTERRTELCLNQERDN